jgi:hypothetical protein
MKLGEKSSNLKTTNKVCSFKVENVKDASNESLERNLRKVIQFRILSTNFTTIMHNLIEARCDNFNDLTVEAYDKT